MRIFFHFTTTLLSLIIGATFLSHKKQKNMPQKKPITLKSLLEKTEAVYIKLIDNELGNNETLNGQRRQLARSCTQLTKRNHDLLEALQDKPNIATNMIGYVDELIDYKPHQKAALKILYFFAENGSQALKKEAVEYLKNHLYHKNCTQSLYKEINSFLNKTIETSPSEPLKNSPAMPLEQSSLG